jgi:hypothetical protein
MICPKLSVESPCAIEDPYRSGVVQCLAETSGEIRLLQDLYFMTLDGKRCRVTYYQIL